jgi:autoinducer 2-degrading protein
MGLWVRTRPALSLFMTRRIGHAELYFLMNLHMLTMLLAGSVQTTAMLLNGAPIFTRPALRFRGGAPSMSADMIGIIVEVNVEPSRMDEFLKVAEADAVGSRAEPGCLRFEVLRSTDSDTRFYFYEVYESAAAVAEHKAQPHFQLWTNFKESGGCKSVSSKAGFPGSWAFPK